MGLYELSGIPGNGDLRGTDWVSGRTQWPLEASNVLEASCMEYLWL